VLLILIKGVKFAYANAPLTGVNTSSVPAALKELRKLKKAETQKIQQLISFVSLKGRSRDDNIKNYQS